MSSVHVIKTTRKRQSFSAVLRKRHRLTHDWHICTCCSHQGRPAHPASLSYHLLIERKAKAAANSMLSVHITKTIPQRPENDSRFQPSFESDTDQDRCKLTNNTATNYEYMTVLSWWCSVQGSVDLACFLFDGLTGCASRSVCHAPRRKYHMTYSTQIASYPLLPMIDCKQVGSQVLRFR